VRERREDLDQSGEKDHPHARSKEHARPAVHEHHGSNDTRITRVIHTISDFANVQLSVSIFHGGMVR
jgi:hypothetical protein